MAKAKAEGSSTAMMKYEEELKKQAEAAAEQEANTGGGQFFSLKNGTLKFNDSPLPDNQMGVVIIDGVIENVYYPGKFNPDEPQPPTCYAFGRNEKTMGPHPEVEGENRQSDTCAECPQNAWGSGEGRGKACRNRRRLAIIGAGKFEGSRFVAEEDPEAFEKAQIAYLALPPTSLNAYGAFVKQLKGALTLPPHGVFTKIKVVPDPKSQFKVTFEAIEKVPSELLPAIMKRHEEAKSVIEFPYSKPDEEKKEQPKATAKKGRKY